MRGHVERDPIAVAVAVDRLEAAARRYASAYLQSLFVPETDKAAEDLRIAACAYAHAIAPKPSSRKRSTSTARKEG